METGGVVHVCAAVAVGRCPDVIWAQQSSLLIDEQGPLLQQSIEEPPAIQDARQSIGLAKSTATAIKTAMYLVPRISV